MNIPRREFLRGALVGGALAAGTSSLAQQSTGGSEPYDTLIKGGHVVDPANNINAPMDIAILDGKIARVARDIPVSSVKQLIDSEGAVKVLDVTGFHVTPGLIDIHTHINYAAGEMNPRDQSFRTGVTTTVSAGSVGAYKLKETVDLFYGPQSNFYAGGFFTPRVLFFLNMSAIGTGTSGKNVLSQYNVPFALESVQQFPELVVGVKCFSQTDFFGDVWFGVTKAEEFSSKSGLPVMYDFNEWQAGRNGYPGRTYEEFISGRIGAGNIHTHCFAPQFPIILPNGRVNPLTIDARKRGVKFDVGHGSGSLVFRNAMPAINQGFLPDSISSDLHGLSTISPVTSLINVASKFLAMGLTLEQVIRCITVNPARMIKRPQFGTLSVGSTADIAIFELRRGNFTYTDSSPGQDLTGGARLRGEYRLDSVATLFGGKVVYDLNGFSYRYLEDIKQGDPYWGKPRGANHAAK